MKIFDIFNKLTPSAFGSQNKGPLMTIILIVCAMVVTLGVFGVINKSSKIEEVADDIIKIETGVDLEKVEEDIEEKNEN